MSNAPTVLVKENNMKKTIAILSLSALAFASVQTASAGNREWATVGKVLTGVAAVHAISHIIHPAPVYAYPVYAVPMYAPPGYVVAPAPVCVQPAPVVVYAPPVCAMPRYYAPPAVQVSVGFGPRHHYHHSYRHCD